MYVPLYDCDDLTTSIDFPSRDSLFNTTNLRNYKRREFYVALFAEESGNPSPVPQQPKRLLTQSNLPEDALQLCAHEK